MAKKKLKRILALPTLPTVVQNPHPYRGRWAEDYFRHPGELVLELGCGKGEYTLELARQFPEKNFIGIDLKGARLFVGASQAIELELKNVAFIRISAQELPLIFAKGEVHEVWIPFPDPFPKKARANKRLTSPRYLQIYRQIVAPGASLYFKTDDERLYEYSLETLQNEGFRIEHAIEDLYHDSVAEADPRWKIQTTYEKRHLALGKKIKLIHFTCM